MQHENFSQLVRDTLQVWFSLLNPTLFILSNIRFQAITMLAEVEDPIIKKIAALLKPQAPQHS